MPNMDTQDIGRVYKISDVAQRIGQSYKTVWKWCRVDKTVRVVVWPSGSLGIPESELRRLMQETTPTPEA